INRMRSTAAGLVLLFAFVFGHHANGIDVKRTFKDQYQKFRREVRKQSNTKPSNPEIVVSPVVFLTSVPPGATVYVDGIRKGITPTGMSLTEGQHQVRFELQGYVDLEDTVTLRNGENRTKTAVLVPTKTEQVAEPTTTTAEQTKTPTYHPAVRTHRGLPIL